MNVSMRSQLTAGAALLRATAIAITPITQPMAAGPFRPATA
ncbi:hypothetical protein [Candidatus Mycolicibacterium alkanivorans]|nr:hypothetical protein [Candidatus Mycolicibacterium alkanivorans]